MNRRWRIVLVIAFCVLGLARARTQAPDQAPRPTLYAVANAHLDSQWNWTVQDTIREFVPATFFDNFRLIERFPHYVFNFEGAIHYAWFKEYYPEAWPTLQRYVAEGRWRLAGSWVNAADVNVPSPESLMRQALYGKRFFRQEFGRVSRDIFLPDCFGFGFALPSIAAHSGLSAFSTQKLTWGSSVPIPFPIGRWKGVDGSSVVAALNPRDYVTRIQTDISVDPRWSNDLTPIGGRSVALRYFGVGDVGGAPDVSSVEWLEKALANSGGTVEVRNTSADQLSRDLTAAETAALPEYAGELTMKTHGVGCYTSQAALKRFNRENELLADAAERAAVAAEWIAGLAYPGARLRDAWTRVLWHQFHDDLTGTSIPQAYQFSWNDELASANQFAAVLEQSTAEVAGLLDTEGPGVPVVVFNPVAAARREPVDAVVRFDRQPPAAVGVIDRATGRNVPVQVIETRGRELRLLFLAEMPSVGYKVFEVRSGRPARRSASTLAVTRASLANGRYLVTIDSNGDLSSILDKGAGRELLRAPARLELRNDPSPDKPAWRILWDTVNLAPREFAVAPRVRIAESGPVRVALEITRTVAGSTIVQRVMLTEGGDRVDVENLVDWQSPNTLLKASFPFAASNPKATYDLGLGTIERGNNTPEHYEVPAQKWADLTDEGGAFGAAVLNDSKYGWDKPADHVLRLTLLHTPMPRAYPYQRSQDLGHHRYTYAIAGHRGDWRAGRVPARAAALNEPLMAFQATRHGGPLGHAFSLLSIDDLAGQVAVRAVKKAEDGDEIVIRLQEQYGRPARTRVRLAGAIVSAREVNAAEEPIGVLQTSAGEVPVDLKPYQPRTLALRPAPPSRPAPVRAAALLALPFNLDGISADADRGDGDFDGLKQTLAAELLAQRLDLGGARFEFGPSTPGALNVLVPKGQVLTLPRGAFDRLLVLAAAVGGGATATFTVAGAGNAWPVSLAVHEWQGPIGQWDSALEQPRLLCEVFVPPMNTKGQTWTAEAIQADLVVRPDPAVAGGVTGIDRIRRGFVARDEIAWIGSHRHAPDGNQPYIATYLFAYAIDLPAGAREVRLPNDGRLRILAATAVAGPSPIRPAHPLYAADLGEPPKR